VVSCRKLKAHITPGVDMMPWAAIYAERLSSDYADIFAGTVHD